MRAKYSADPDGTNSVILDCGGRVFPQSKSFHSDESFLPLGKVHPREKPQGRPGWTRQPSPNNVLIKQYKSHFGYDKKCRRYHDNHLLITSSDQILKMKCRGEVQGRKSSMLDNLIERQESHPFGPENCYNGSCLRVEGDLVLYTGNEKDLLVSRLVPDAVNKVFPRVCDAHSTTSLSNGKIGFTRVFGLDTRRISLEETHVVIKYRYGWSLARVMEKEPEQEESDCFKIEDVTSLPCSEGLIQTSFLSGDRVAYLASNGILNIWDLETGQVRLRSLLKHLLDPVVERLRFSWGILAQGFHPRSILVGDREQIASLDLRSAKIQTFDLKLETFDQIRQVDRVSVQPYIYSVTDNKILLSDLRQPKYPIISLDHGLATNYSTGNTPVAGFGRLRSRQAEGLDYLMVYNKLGDMSLSCLDWSHSQCPSGSEAGVKFRCNGSSRTRVPVVLGNPNKLGGWRETVTDARQMGGQWLDQAVEERCAIPFTGVDLAEEKDGSLMAYLVNSVDDLFGKRIVVDDNNMLEDEENEIEEIVVKRREDKWLEDWGRSVVSAARLNKVILRSTSRLVDHSRKTKFWSYPLYRKTRRWSSIKVPGKGRWTGGLPVPCSLGWKDDMFVLDYRGETSKLKLAGLKQFMAEQYRLGPVTNISDKRQSKVKDWFGFAGLHISDKTNTDYMKTMKRKTTELIKIARSGPEVEQLDVIDPAETQTRGCIDAVPYIKEIKQMDRYLPGSEYKYTNRHSESVLQILLGQGHPESVHDREVAAQFNDESRQGSPGPQPPQEEDSTFTMDAFWADLGVEAPFTKSNDTVNDSQKVEDDPGSDPEEDWEL